jgi:hypothetical protein
MMRATLLPATLLAAVGAHAAEPEPEPQPGEAVPAPAEGPPALPVDAPASKLPADAQFPETIDPALVDALKATDKRPDDARFPESPERTAAIAAEVKAAYDPLRTIRGAHGADKPVRERRDPSWDAWGELRGRVNGMSDPALDPQGTTSGRTVFLQSRLLAGADWRPTENITVEMELEALNGHLAGETTAVGTGYADDVFRVRRADSRDLRRILPRKLGVSVLFPKAGQLRVGAQMFSWGTGMLANDGAGDPDFGDANTGSTVARVGFFTQPWKNSARANDPAKGLTIFAAGDVVLRDDNADLFLGDLAVAGILGLRFAHPWVDAGVFGVARWQRDRDDVYNPRPDRTTVTAFPVDLYAKVLLLPPGHAHRLVLEGEGVLIHGVTDRPYLDETVEGGGRIQSVGGLGRLRYDNDQLRITAKLEAGFASGDNDPRDAVTRQFSFHSDYNVGMLLFEEILPLVTARSVDRAADPNLVGVPSSGARYTVNQGTVTNAVYLNPVLRYRPLPLLDLRLGYVAAWSAGDFVDAFETGANGGYNTTPGGVRGGEHFLGHELDLGVRYTFQLPGRTAIEIGLEGSAFLPGAAFDGVGGDRLGTQGLGRGRLAFQW